MAGNDVRDGRARTPNETAWMITGRLVAGMVLYGGIGWLLGRWLGHEPLFIAGGLLIGMAASLYLVYARLRHEEQQESGNAKPSKGS